ncbi:WD40-repeat-containing domain protein [Blyttiomyces helicus]|uniref:WD40-repeat-containing domain protein n=1 Tax=Blyttiomyces helicus TaxID=388810 RepID=A0A4P9W425_9FUNG|nr:WD40-repeat-containing domain protein [Blyttiomyces helicus]|eukprot:RKO87089.1 WD40-repeat-containing domain protein [Blyttiomyces helicus]
MQGAGVEQFELHDPPTDGITSVVFSPDDPSLLLVGSWDKHVRLYDVVANQLRLKYPSKAAVLDVAFSDSVHGFSAGLDRRLKMVDLHTTTETILGSHDDAIRCVEYCKETGNIITGSWDKTVRVWDPRSNDSVVGKYMQPAKIYSLDVAQNKLVVAMAGRSVYIYDVRNMKETLQRRESSLKFMARMVRCMPNGEGYASSSIEGRVAVEFFDPSPEMQAKKYAFKCHRQKQEEVETVYPVNALAFHPIHGTFASGGGDGVVNVWDGFNKKRLRVYPKYPTSIASMSFNSDGRLLAVASSYTFEEGEKDHPPDSIFIRPVSDADTKPKQPAA